MGRGLLTYSMLLSFVRLPHPATCFAAVEFDVRRGREGEEGGRERKRGKRKGPFALRFSSSREN